MVAELPEFAAARAHTPSRHGAGAGLWLAAGALRLVRLPAIFAAVALLAADDLLFPVLVGALVEFLVVAWVSHGFFLSVPAMLTADNRIASPAFRQMRRTACPKRKGPPVEGRAAPFTS